MTLRVIENHYDVNNLKRFIDRMEPPYTVEVKKGRRRSVEQNRLYWRWIGEIAEQTLQTPDEVRALCKLQYGVPILRAASELFRDTYDEVIKPLPYEQKLKLMGEGIDFPVTSIMKVKQFSEYLDTINREFSAQGIVLTQPKPRHGDEAHLREQLGEGE